MPKILVNVSGHGKVAKERIGGVEKVVLERVNYLAEKGYDVTLFGDFPWKTPNVKKVEFTKRMGGSIKHLLKIVLFMVSGIIKLIKIDADIFVSTHERNFPLTLIAGKLRRIPIVACELDHDPWVPPFTKIKKVYHFLVKKADLIIVMSTEQKKRIVDQGISLHKTHVIYQGINTQVYQPKPSVRKRSQIIYVAKFAERKNHLALLKALKLVKKKIADFKLVLVGPKSAGFTSNAGELSEYFLRCEEFIKKNQLVKNVKMLENIPEKRLITLYQESGLFVIPSVEEGFGLTLLEAMTCGCACIVNNVEPMAEVIGNAGILVDANNINLLAKKIELVLKNPALQNKLGRQARKRALDVFNLQKINQQFEKALKTVL